MSKKQQGKDTKACGYLPSSYGIKEAKLVGDALMNQVQISNEKKLTLLLLCWLLGIFAVHRFYTGKYLTGSLQLLIITFGGVSAFGRAQPGYAQ